MNQVVAVMVDHIQGGEEDLITELWEKFRPLWTKWARNTGLCGYDEEDLWQQSYIILSQSLKNFDTALGVPFEGYYELALRRWRAAKSRRLCEKEYLLFEEKKDNHQVPDESVNVEMQVIENERYQEVHRLLETLTKEQQLLIKGFYMEYKTLGEVAALLGVSYRHAENQKMRILKALKKQIQ